MIISTDNLFRAWHKFRRGKRSKLDVQIFERKLEENIFNLQYQLKHDQYKHSRYKPFTVFDPKQRKIHKATVRDRLIHQALTQVVEPRFESSFIYDSFSCRKGKGTHAAIDRLRSMLQQASNSNSRTIYALKLDIRKFFASVDHHLLLGLLKRKVSDKPTTHLIEEIIGSFSVEVGRGIPLGNLTSQLFANIYLHELDWYVKQTLREKCYVRYCDDFVILSKDRKYLEDLVPIVGDFLSAQLNLTIHPNKIIIRNWNQGIDFLGYVLKPHCTVLRNKTKARMLRNVDSVNITSYLGMCSYAASYELQQLVSNKVGVVIDELLN
ncbi:MAG TPA: reverse transcriptase domain-containing protein [Candidatus Saccharibacteria bacterium]|nr:reverse transcriptase domain-containing protein [Candidatus Saccharibacteria bacterium]HMT39977.1 reverse transcriptase domain-containing protein [Candidatus Saccharibacteria bacterium]